MSASISMIRIARVPPIAFSTSLAKRSTRRPRPQRGPSGDGLKAHSSPSESTFSTSSKLSTRKIQKDLNRMGKNPLSPRVYTEIGCGVCQRNVYQLPILQLPLNSEAVDQRNPLSLHCQATDELERPSSKSYLQAVGTDAEEWCNLLKYR
jgi:hypothetical protein